MILWCYRFWQNSPTATTFRASRIGVITEFIQFSWTENFRGFDELSLVIPANITFLQLGTLIYRADIDKVMIITSILKQRAGDIDTIEVNGFGLEKFFNWRVLLNRPAANTTINFINSLVLLNNRWLPFSYNSTLNKNIPTNFNINFYDIISEIDNLTVYEAIEKCMYLANIGLKIHNEKTENEIIINYSFFRGTDRSKQVTFSEQFDNIKTFDLYNSNNKTGNIAYVSVEDSRPFVKTASEWTQDAVTRFEFWASKSAKDLSEAQAIADLEILQRVELKTIEAEVNLTNTQFIFRQDFDIGDIVRIVDPFNNESFNLPVLSATEFYDTQGMHTLVTFGHSNIPSSTKILNNVR